MNGLIKITIWFYHFSALNLTAVYQGKFCMIIIQILIIQCQNSCLHIYFISWHTCPSLFITYTNITTLFTLRGKRTKFKIEVATEDWEQPVVAEINNLESYPVNGASFKFTVTDKLSLDVAYEWSTDIGTVEPKSSVLVQNSSRVGLCFMCCLMLQPQGKRLAAAGEGVKW